MRDNGHGPKKVLIGVPEGDNVLVSFPWDTQVDRRWNDLCGAST